MGHASKGVRRPSLRFLFLTALFIELFPAREMPAAPPAPTDIRSWGQDPDSVNIQWRGLGDDFVYEIHRQEGNGGYQLLSTEPAVAAGDAGTFPDVVPDPTKIYRYKIRAKDPGDDSLSGFSPVVRFPTYLTLDDFRLFYNLSDCPTFDGVANCLPDAGLADTIGAYFEGALAEYQAQGFRTPVNPSGTDRYPVNLKDCDGGGCTGSTGIGIKPGAIGSYDPDTNGGSAFTLFVTVHELFHAVQGAYGGVKADPAKKWVIEGQARAIQDLVCVHTDSDPCVNVDDDPNGSANYFSQVNSYLGNPNQPINEASYTAALFWTYLCQRYGAIQEEPRRGIDFLKEFWDEADAGAAQRDGIQVIDATLSNLGESDAFVDAFQDFCLVNYTKDLPNSPAASKYVDESQPPGSFDAVKLSLDKDLGPGDQLGPTFTDVRRWGARYFRVNVQPGLSEVNLEFHVESPDPAFFALLPVKGGAVVGEDRHTGKDYSKSLANPAGDPYESVTVVVAGLDHDVNFHYSFNAEDPTLRILRPTSSQPAYVGLPGSPGKLVAKVEVLNPDASGVQGLNGSDFAFLVGAQAVDPAIQTFYVGGGQYWFVLQAPDQAAAGDYELSVSWSSLSASRSDAVSYGATLAPTTTNAILIDRTPSMLMPPSKLTAAKAAGQLYVDSYREGDKIAVTSLSGDGAAGCTSTAEIGYRDWTSDSRHDAIEAINLMNAPSGKTSIGKGLLTALAEVEKDTTLETDSWAILLFSDGLTNCGEDISAFMTQFDARTANGDRVPVVHTVAIGPDADRPDLQKLADDTGGDYMFVPEPGGNGGALSPDEVDFQFSLVEKHRIAMELIEGESQVVSERGDSLPLKVVPVTVEKGATELILTLSWSPEKPGFIALADPGGNTNYPPVLQTGAHQVWRIALPQAGVWQVAMRGTEKCPSDCKTNFLLEGSVRSALSLYAALGLPVEERVVGNPMPVLAALSDTGPVKGATVKATITNPFLVPVTIDLHDDGAHGDGKAGDGVYGGMYHFTTLPGTYQVEVTAQGSTPLIGPFVRKRGLAFHLLADVNKDKDCVSRTNPFGLPDGWERRHGLDPTRDDGAEDPDGDGLTNCEEYQRGTDPLDPDTDDDGESDGSEVAHGRDPLDPSDGAIRPPRICAQGLVGRVLVRYHLPRGMTEIEVSRADGKRGSFKVLGTFPVAKEPVFLDRDVTNDVLYRYLVVGLGRDGARSGPSDPCGAVPRKDPYPPHGDLLINGGAPTTGSRIVELTLSASDLFSPENADGEVFERTAEVSGVADRMVSNRSDFEGASWEPFAALVPGWTIEPGPSGMATVFARFRDRAGNVSETAQSSIRLAGSHALRISPAELSPCGQAGKLFLELDSSEEVAAVVVGLEWKPSLLDVLAIKPGPDVPAAGIESFQAVLSEAPLHAGQALVHLSLDPPLPAGAGLRVLEIEARPGSDAAAGGSAEICMVDGLGTPAEDTTISVIEGKGPLTVHPDRSCGKVTFAKGEGTGCFRRGDANVDGGSDISDGIFILSFLFLGTEKPPCEKAADTNDDGKLDISDGVFLLDYLFLGGPRTSRSRSAGPIPPRIV